MALIGRLRSSFPSLEKYINDNKDNGWVSGQGFRGSGSYEAPELYEKKWLPSGKMSPYFIDLDSLEILPRQKLDRPRRDIRIYRGPLVVTTRGLGKEGFYAAFSPGDVVYTEEYYGISIPKDQESMAHYLNGVLNSSLASYFLFMTASVWGVERDKVEPNDLLRLPIPLPDVDNHSTVTQIIGIERMLCQSSNGPTREKLKEQLNKAVFMLYGLDEVEQLLIQDAKDFTIDFRMNRERSEALKRPSFAELETYAERLISVIQPFFQTLHEQTMQAVVFDVAKAPLQVVKFSIVSMPGRASPVSVVPTQALEPVLRRIADLLPQGIADTIYIRRILQIHVDDDFYIVKPAQRRYWSQSAGLNDADVLLTEQLGQRGRGYATIRRS